jgi:hypothetical protein
MVDERFDLSKKILSWRFGNSSETYSYDQVKILAENVANNYN